MLHEVVLIEYQFQKAATHHTRKVSIQEAPSAQNDGFRAVRTRPDESDFFFRSLISIYEARTDEVRGYNRNSATIKGLDVYNIISHCGTGMGAKNVRFF